MRKYEEEVADVRRFLNEKKMQAFDLVKIENGFVVAERANTLNSITQRTAPN